MKTAKSERQRRWEDIEWARKHSTELTRQYGLDQQLTWVAIFNKKVIAFGPNRGKVRQIAAEKTGRPADKIFIDFVEGRAAIL